MIVVDGDYLPVVVVTCRLVVGDVLLPAAAACSASGASARLR